MSKDEQDKDLNRPATGMSADMQAEAAASLRQAGVVFSDPASASDAALNLEEPISQGYEFQLTVAALQAQGLLAEMQTADSQWQEPAAERAQPRFDDDTTPELEASRRFALERIDAEISRTTDPDSLDRLIEARRNVEGARGKEALRGALEAASMQIKASANERASAGVAALPSREEINALHREMYEHDPIYRAETDHISAEAETHMQVADERAKRLSELAKRHGIHTEFDEAVEKAEREAEEARRNKNHLEAREAEAKLMALRAKQNAAREAEAQRFGLSTEAAEFHHGQTQDRNEFDDAMGRLRAQREAFLKAQVRVMKEKGKSEEEIKENTKGFRQRFEKEDGDLSQSHDLKEARLLTRTYKERAEGSAADIKHDTSRPSPATQNPTTDLNGPASKSELQSLPARMEAVSVSAAEPVAPASVPPSLANLENLVPRRT